jgi:WD40 repeat protein
LNTIIKSINTSLVSQVNAVDRSPDGTLLATGDDFKRVKIFKNPCPKEKSKFKEYKGHSEFVINVKFSKDGKWLYTVGGLDKAVCQFEIKAVSNSGYKDIVAPVVPVKISPVATVNNSRNRKK